MTNINPRRPSLLQARDLRPLAQARSHAHHSHSRSHLRSRSRSHLHPLARAQRHDLDADPSQPSSQQQQQQHLHAYAYEKAAPERRDLPRDTDDSASSLPARIIHVADAVDGIPLVTKVVQAVSLVQLAGTAAAASLVAAEPDPVVAELKPKLPDLPVSPDLGVVETAFRGVAKALGPLETAAPGAALEPIGPILSPPFTNASAQAAVGSSSLTSPQATRTPPAPSIPQQTPFSDGRNATSTQFQGTGSSSTPSMMSSTPSFLNATQHRLSAAFNTGSSTTQSTSRSPTSKSTAFLVPTSSPPGHTHTTTFATTTASSEDGIPPTQSVFFPDAPPTGAENPPLITAGYAPASSTAASTGSGSSSNLTPQQKQVIGSVVGSVAGIAFISLLIMLVLRRRRRMDGRGLSFIGPSAATAMLASGSRGGGASDAAAGSANRGGTADSMMERYRPAALAASLGTLVGRHTDTPCSSTDGGERGFYRVSGRKLPSVLQVGGDGYTDPRESSIIGSYSYNDNHNSNSNSNDNNTFAGVSGAPEVLDSSSPQAITSRLALGNPMRPVSGIPIVRSGPARTPVTVTTIAERNPFADQPSTPSHDGQPSPVPAQRDSPPGSRFRESM